MFRLTNWWLNWWPFILVAVGILGVGGLIIAAAIAEDAACKARGGHIYSQTGSGFGFSTSGQFVPTFTTTSTCISSDGRILE